MRLNLNETVKVKLTERGKKIYREHFSHLPDCFEKPEPRIDEDGFTEMQLWMFMEIFGEHMSVWKPNVIEPLEIVFDTEDSEACKEQTVEPKPVMTEEVREAIMRLTMCAREECSICKYENDCGYDKQVEMATENMHTILNGFAERPKGEWKTDMVYAGIEFYRCDQCEYRQSEKTRYCPNCGARMKGGDDE